MAKRMDRLIGRMREDKTFFKGNVPVQNDPAVQFRIDLNRLIMNTQSCYHNIGIALSTEKRSGPE